MKQGAGRSETEKEARNLEEDRRYIKLIECTSGKSESDRIALHAIDRAINAEKEVTRLTARCVRFALGPPPDSNT